MTMLPYLPHPEAKSAKCDLAGPCLHQAYRLKLDSETDGRIKAKRRKVVARGDQIAAIMKRNLKNQIGGYGFNG